MDSNIDKKMENNKNKKLFIAIIALIVLLIGGTYAWYLVSVKGTSENIIKAGKLSLVLDESESIAIDLSNSLPMTDSQGLETTAYTFKVKNNGDISSTYTIYLDDIQLESGETRMLDKYVKYSLTKDGSPAVTALLPTIGINPNRILDSGIIDADTTHIYTLRLWIDKDADNAVMNTTFRGKLRIEAAQATGMICRRATALHKETCSYSDKTVFCGGAGYSLTGSKKTTEITYGNIPEKGVLKSGDAFDCDVNGDGAYDSETERFYYVLDVDANTSALIYYNNTALGLPSNNTATSYDVGRDAFSNGPATAVMQLPSTTQWPNVSLTSTTRNITDELGTVKKANFSYQNYAARMLTIQEVSQACKVTIGSMTVGELDKCTYLMENTKFSSNDNGTWGFWLENAKSDSTVNAWYANGGTYRYINFRDVSLGQAESLGVRPVIEVPKVDILN